MSEGHTATFREALESDPLGLARRRDDLPSEPASPNSGAAVARLVAVVAAAVGLGYLAGVGETVVLVLALLACIVAHEAGHLLTAKAGRIKVTEFFVGFGPRLWSIRRGETEYGVKAIPLGGYCRIIGMNSLEKVDPADEPRTYRQAPLARRLSVAVAGSAMHFLIALAVLFAMFFWTGDAGNYLRSPQALPASNPVVQILGFTNGPSPAEEAGFHLGDRIVAVDGYRFASWTAMAAFIQSHAGVRLDVEVLRSGHLVQLYPVPVNERQVKLAGSAASSQLPAGTKPVGFIGIAVSPIIHSSAGEAASRAGGAWVQVSAETMDALGRFFSLHGISSYVHMLSSSSAARADSGGVRFISPVGAVRLLHQATVSGLPTVLWLVALINISIGIFNLLPIFPLDGGHVVVALYEGAVSLVRRRRYHLDVAKVLPLFYLGLALIVVMGAGALFMDLRSLAA